MNLQHDIILFLFFSRILQLEEEFIQRVCSDIIALKPDVVFTEKGVSGETVVDNNGHYAFFVSNSWFTLCCLSVFQAAIILVAMVSRLDYQLLFGK